MYFLERTRNGTLRPNQKYYELELQVFYGGKIRQHGKPRKMKKIIHEQHLSRT